VSFLDPYIPTRTGVHVLGGMFFLTAAISWMAVGVDWAQLRAASSAGGTVALSDKLAHARTASFVAGTQLVCLAATALAFLAWLYRVRVNVRALGARRLRYARQWTLLGFLVPFANVLRPYQVISEIWRASDPHSTDPIAWQRQSPPRLLLYWWAAFVAYVVTEGLSLVIVDGAVAATTRQIGFAFGMLADACAGVAASLAYFVVSGISEAQDAKYEQFGRLDAATQLTLDPRDALA
jgi:hypothetical protein